MFNYQPNQNTSSKVKSVVNMNRQLKRLSNRRRSEQPFYLPRVYPGVRELFSLNPGVTRDSWVTPGLPLDSKTGHKKLSVTSKQQFISGHALDWLQHVMLQRQMTALWNVLQRKAHSETVSCNMPHRLKQFPATVEYKSLHRLHQLMLQCQTAKLGDVPQHKACDTQH